jgi:hypothetical protein
MLGTGNHGVFYLADRPDQLPVQAQQVAVKVLTRGKQPGHVPPGHPGTRRVRRG